MKSNYFLGNGCFEVREEPIPAVGENDVLVRVAACGICGTGTFHHQGKSEVWYCECQSKGQESRSPAFDEG